MDPVNIFYIILALCASALCIALIIYLNKITKSINNLQNEVDDVANRAKPLIASINGLSDKLNDIAEDAKEQVDVIKNLISDIKDHAEKILALEEKVRRGIETPVTDITTNLSAIVNGINTFWKTYKDKHHT